MINSYAHPAGETPARDLDRSTAGWPARGFAHPPALVKFVFVAGKLACSVELSGEPASDPLKVSQDPRAAENGVIALAAHGRDDFAKLGTGDRLSVLMASGPARHYKVSAHWSFECLADPRKNSRWTIEHNSQYRNLSDNTVHPTAKLWQYFYGSGDRVVFNTCIAKADNPQWGRLYVVADRQP